MLHIITGKKGSGKTTYLHSCIGSLVKNEDREVTLIVPRRFTFETDSGILDILGAKDACAVEVLSFFRLAQSVLKTQRGIKNPPLSDGANVILMSDALSALKDRLTFFRKHLSNTAFIVKMLQEIKMYKRCLVSAQDLRRAAAAMTDSLLKEKTEETALIYETYDALVAASYYDENDLLKIVYDIMLQSDFFFGKTVAIDGFSTFSAQEIKIIKLMLRRCEDVYVTLCTDNGMDTDPSSPFASVNSSYRKLMSAFNESGCQDAETILVTDEKNGFKTYNAPELRALESSVYRPNFTPYDGDASAVTLFFSPSVKQECDYAASRIKRMLREGLYRCRDIAVVFRDEKIYQKELRNSLKKYGVPVFEDKRQPIENEPIIVFVRALLELCSSSFKTEKIMSLLKTYLYSINAEEVAVIENYAVMWNIDGDEWKRAWSDNPDGFGVEMDDEKSERLLELNELRSRIVTPLIRLSNELEGQSAENIIRSLYNFLIEEGINENLKQYAIALEASGNFELAREQQQVWDILMEVLDEIAKTAGQRVLDVKRIKEIFDLVVLNKTLGKLPDGFDEVSICTPDRIVNITQSVVFVLGVNEGVFPKTGEEKGVFTSREREKLNDVLGSFDESEKQASMDERFLVYNSLCAARERLFISWSVSNVNGEKNSESEIVSMVKNILPRVKTVNTTLVPIEEKLESEKAAFEIMAQSWNEDTEQANTLKAYFSDKAEYEGKLEAIERAGRRNDFSIKNKNTAKELFGKNMVLSATTYEEYEKCPFKYFCKYAVKAKERKQAKLDPSLGGSLVHYVLEKVLSKFKNRGIKAEDREGLLKEAESVLNEYIERYMGGTRDKSDRFMYLYRRTYKVLVSLIDRLIFEFDDSDFVPADFELKISYDKDSVRPYRITFSDGYADFIGSVDRVDVMSLNGKNYLRVVDYKTGTKDFSLSDVIDGIGAQMLIYLKCICQNAKGIYGENIVPAGVLYFPARLDPFSAERGATGEEMKLKRLGAGKMQGMVLNDGDVISGMSRSMNGVVMPFGIDSKGNIKGNFISLDELKKLSDKIDSSVRQMCTELHSGNIPAYPAYGKNNTQTCEWCPYQSVCMAQEGVRRRKLKDLSHAESIGLLLSEE